MTSRTIKNACAILSVVSAVSFVLFAGCASPEVVTSDRLAAAGIRISPEPRRAPEGPLTLDRAIELAIEESDQMAAARAFADVAKNAMLAAYDHRDPRLSLSYRGRYSYTEQLRLDYDYGVTLPGELSSTQTVNTSVDVRDSYAAAISIYPQNPFERRHRISSAGADNKAAVAEVRMTKWEVSIEVRRLFAHLDCLQKEAIVLDQLVAVQEDMLKMIRSQVSQGQLTAQDMIKVSQNYLAALSDANRTARERDQIRADLADYLNLPASEVNIVVDEKTFPDPDVDSMNIDELVQQAMLDRSDLAALHWKTRAAYEAWQQAEAAKVPWLSQMQAVYTSYAGEQSTDLGSKFGVAPSSITGVDDTSAWQWRIDFDITIPFFSWTMNHESDLKASEYRQAKSMESSATKKACLNVRSALDMMRSIRKSRLQYKADTASILFDMQKTLDNAESAAGLTPDQLGKIKLDMLDAERLKFETERHYRLAFIKLEEAIGGPCRKSEAPSEPSGDLPK